jgi:hypothetical protein
MGSWAAASDGRGVVASVACYGRYRASASGVAVAFPGVPRSVAAAQEEQRAFAAARMVWPVVV